MTTTEVPITHHCQHCGQPAKLQCPTCRSGGLKPSYFCGKACFNTAWPTHKLLHVSASKHNPFPHYHFTGPLRPVYPLSAKRPITSPRVQKPDYADHPQGKPESELKNRSVKTLTQLSKEDQEKMRETCRRGRIVLNAARELVKPGVTTDEIDRVVHDKCMELDCYPSPLNYMTFPKSCCTSINEVICHGIPDQYELQEGDICNIDVTTYFDGFHGDLNETYPVGKIDAESAKLIRVTKESLDKAIEACKPGALYRDMGAIISKHASANNISVVKSYCGHGIHRLFHCNPNVPHYAGNKTPGVMRPGHTFTIEPMLNLGSWHDTMWPDNWTAVTQDGKRSAQFEHTLLITETGVEILTADPDAERWWADKGVF